MIQSKQNEQAAKIGNWIASRLTRYETILFLIFVFGLTLKVSTDVAIEIIIVLTLFALAIMYFFFAFATSVNENAGVLEVFFHKISCMALSAGTIGILFRLENWAGYQTMMLCGCISLLIILLIGLILKSKKNDLKIIRPRFIIRFLIICVFVLFLAFSSTNSLVKYKLIDVPKIEEVK
jgi:hypothetical protein